MTIVRQLVSAVLELEGEARETLRDGRVERALVLLADEFLDLRQLDREQVRERTHVDDVLEELPLARSL